MLTKPLLLTVSSIVLSSLLLQAAVVRGQDTCQVLALEGGGDKGAYEAGALWTLVNNATNPNNVQYDVITGVSIGAINTALLSQYPKGQEAQMAQQLINLWSTIESDDIYQEYWGGVVYAALFKPSLFDTSPGRTLLNQYVTGAPVRQVSIGTVNANTGQFERFNESLGKDDFISAALCSSAMPAIFPYQQFQGNTYIDGGCTRNLDIGAGVLRCRNQGFSDDKIVVDTIFLDDGAIQDVVAEDFSTLQMLMRTLEIKSYNSAMSYLLTAKYEFPNVQFRYAVTPSTKLPSSSIPIGFNTDNLNTMIQLGKSDALAAIQKGEGVSFNEAFALAAEVMKGDPLSVIDPAKLEKVKMMLKMEKEAKEQVTFA